jgi:ornithine--oxo-acid transaminase
MDDAIKLETRYSAHNYEPLPVVLTRGKGAHLWDTSGRRYVDMMSAYSAASHGHAHPRILAVLTAQAKRLAVPSRAYYSDRLGPFLEELCTLTGLDAALPMNTGAEAVETAIKAARRWGYRVKGIARDRAEIIVASGNFHGRTSTVISFSTEGDYRDGFGPFTPGFRAVPFGDLAAIERAITPETAAVLVEPIQGEGGINIPDDGYLPGLRKLCDEAGILLVLDEIQTGMGRTGRLWGYEHSGIEPDIMTLAKALANGVPIGATLATESVASAFTPGTHGSTFGGNPFATAVGVTVFATLMEERLPERAAAMGRALREQLEALRARRPKAATAVRGRGLLVGMDLVPPVGEVIGACRERGLLALSAGDNTLRLAPPLVVDEAAIRHAIEIIDQALAGFVK